VTFAFGAVEHFERVVQAGARRLRLSFGDRSASDAEVGEGRERVDQVDSHGSVEGPCLQTNPQCDPGGAITICITYRSMLNSAIAGWAS
jgi:hypothetical protein